MLPLCPTLLCFAVLLIVTVKRWQINDADDDDDIASYVRLRFCMYFSSPML